MTLKEFLEYVNSAKEIDANSEISEYMHKLADEARKITMKINCEYHSQQEIVKLMRDLTKREVPDSFRLFPPIYTDCGKNIEFGENVFLNAGCKIQDQGGIKIGDGSFLGHNVVLSTLNHNKNPKKRANTIPRPINIGKNVRIGSNAVICQGVNIGDNAIVAAGAVVVKDVKENTIVAGVPAKFIKYIDK
ncbi:MAG: DapH/DapD/GlmU-related protein [Tissierellia bacterium]|nr:DapH/DapD/GlmU-related protein [Tissierellia bacterium]